MTLKKDIMKTYRHWSGNRDEFIELLRTIEESDPKKRMLSSKKKPIKDLPISSRRILWFTTEKMMPKPKDKSYSFEHFVFYWAVIYLRKVQKRTFKQLEDLYLEISTEQATDYAKGLLDPNYMKIKSFNSPGDPTEKTISEDISIGLKRMGREEGRPLKSTLLRLAITPWCHVTINENNLDDLTDEDVHLLSEAFSHSLSKTIRDR